VYVGTSARLSYALGEEREMPSALASTNPKGVPVVSILVAFVVGCLALGPFKSWNALVSVVTSATAIMYAFGPLSLAALHKLDAHRARAYRAPLPKILLPAVAPLMEMADPRDAPDTAPSVATAPDPQLRSRTPSHGQPRPHQPGRTSLRAVAPGLRRRTTP